MDTKVQEFLEQKRTEQATVEEERIKKEKRKVLLNLKLTEKVYSPTNQKTEEYNFAEWDYKTQTNKYYKRIYPEITNEELEELKKYTTFFNNSEETQEWSMFTDIGAKIKKCAKNLFIIGVTMAVIFILISLILSIIYNAVFFFSGLLICVISIFASWFSAVAFYSLGDIIENISKIKCILSDNLSNK